MVKLRYVREGRVRLECNCWWVSPAKAGLKRGHGCRLNKCRGNNLLKQTHCQQVHNRRHRQHPKRRVIMKGFAQNAALKFGSFSVRKSGGLQAVTWSAARVGPLSLIPPARAKSGERSVATPTRREQGTCCGRPAAGKGPPDTTRRQAPRSTARRHRGRRPLPPFLGPGPAAKPKSGSEKRTRFGGRKTGPISGPRPTLRVPSECLLLHQALHEIAFWHPKVRKA